MNSSFDYANITLLSCLFRVLFSELRIAIVSIPGILITSLVQTKLPSFGDSSLAQEAFTSILSKLVDVGVSGALAFNLLGDLTTNLDGLANGEDEEAVRMDLWQIVGK